MSDLSTRDTARGPKNLYFPFIENLREEDNLSIKGKAAEFTYIAPKVSQTKVWRIYCKKKFLYVRNKMINYLGAQEAY